MAQSIKLTNIKFSIDEIEIAEQGSFKNFLIGLLEDLEKLNSKNEEKIIRPAADVDTESSKTENK